MSPPIFSTVAALLYFGWLWHNRSATEERRLLRSISTARKAKVQRKLAKHSLAVAATKKATGNALTPRPMPPLALSLKSLKPNHIDCESSASIESLNSLQTP
jgi:hypothetical protein